ncbi:MAG: tyrosine-type recombinase/integrase [Planctomycetes bacterium]|nr:tyrosine-type recombinase/integrase [Planctomycetota bacterium]
MSNLRQAVEAYLTLRRGLGFELKEPGQLLRRFVEFMEREGASRITTDLAVRWAKLPTNAQQATWAARLGFVRRFAMYQSAIDPRTEVPPAGLLPRKYQRQQPYIYTESEIRQLIKAAKRITSPTGLRAWTYSTLLGLLAVTGMRIAEAIALDRSDVDLAEGILAIRRTKCRKSRLVPVHESTRRVLEQYERRRHSVHPRPKTAAFLVSERGLRLNQATVRWTFVQLSREVGLRASARSHGDGPRLYDMRHRLAVSTLVRWYRSGVDVERHLPVLATYLGHTKVTDTYWYLSAVPELVCLAVAQMEKGALAQ